MKYLILLSLFFCIQVFAKKPSLSDLPAVGVGGYGGAVGGGYPGTGNERDIREETLQKYYSSQVFDWGGHVETVRNSLKNLNRANDKKYRQGKKLFEYRKAQKFSNQALARKDLKDLKTSHYNVKKNIARIEDMLKRLDAR